MTYEQLVRQRDHVPAILADFAADNGFAYGRTGVALMEIGSTSYGLRTEASDYDYFAVVLPPRKRILGLHKWDGWEPKKDAETGVDAKAYSLEKFVRLAVGGNPNVVETLFLDAEHYLHATDDWRWMLNVRGDLINQQTFEAFHGYAKGQINKIEKGKTSGRHGSDRKALIERHGYDTKDASRLIHLLYMAGNMGHGDLNPKLTGLFARNVREIKAGVWPLDEVMHLSDILWTVNESLKHKLPPGPDTAMWEDLLVEMTRVAVR